MEKDFSLNPNYSTKSSIAWAIQPVGAYGTRSINGEKRWSVEITSGLWDSGGSPCNLKQKNSTSFTRSWWKWGPLQQDMKLPSIHMAHYKLTMSAPPNHKIGQKNPLHNVEIVL